MWLAIGCSSLDRCCTTASRATPSCCVSSEAGSARCYASIAVAGPARGIDRRRVLTSQRHPTLIQALGQLAGDRLDLREPAVELASAIHDYIEIWHNTKRRHSALNMLTPSEYENQHQQQEIAA